jgi:hypothetical protein
MAKNGQFKEDKYSRQQRERFEKEAKQRERIRQREADSQMMHKAIKAAEALKAGTQ